MLLSPLPRLACATTVLAAVALLAACGTQAVHERPEVPTPAAYKEAAAATASGVWRPAQPGGAASEAWWTLYGDATLNHLQQQAAIDNQNIALSVARLRAAQAAVAGSSAGQLPSVGASASSGRTRSGSSLADGSSTARISTSHALGLNASWELDLWGRVGGAVAAARASAQASAADLAAMRLSVQATVAQTYFALRAAESQARLLGDTLAAYERSWELTRNRQKAGVASAADAAQAEAQYKSTQVQWLESETSRAQLEHALAALVGQVPAAFSLPATAELPQPPAVPAQLPSAEEEPVVVAVSAAAESASSSSVAKTTEA